MIGLNNKPRKNAGASNTVDAAGRVPVLSRNGQGFLKHVWCKDLKKLVRAKQIRVYTLTENTEELARALRKRRIDICALQEIPWSGVTSFDLERERGKNGYKLLHFGNPHIQYGVDIATSEGFRHVIEEVERFDDRLMKLTIISADLTIHHICTTRPDAEKDDFWQLLDAKTWNMPASLAFL